MHRLLAGILAVILAAPAPLWANGGRNVPNQNAAKPGAVPNALPPSLLPSAAPLDGVDLTAPLSLPKSPIPHDSLPSIGQTPDAALVPGPTGLPGEPAAADSDFFFAGPEAHAILLPEDGDHGPRLLANTPAMRQLLQNYFEIRKAAGAKEEPDPAQPAAARPRAPRSETPPETVEPKYDSRPIVFNGKTFPSVGFRPDRPVEPLIVDAIDAAQTSIVIAMYEFKSQAILKALRRAKQRGVSVRLIVDFENTFPRKREGSDYVPHRSLELQSLFNEGFDITVLRGLWRYGIMHNKFFVADQTLGFQGSYNLTYTSERNHFENARFTADPGEVKGLLNKFEYMSRFSLKFQEARHYEWPTEIPPPPAYADPDVNFNRLKLPAWVFSPGGAAEEWIVRAIDKAKLSIDLSMFTFRSTRIAEALERAHRERGVKVRVIFDQSQGNQPYMKTYAEWLVARGIPVKLLAGPNPDGNKWAEKNHNKFMVLDGKLVETGSMNYTKNAFFMSFENAFFTTNKKDAGAYSAYFADLYSNPRAEPVAAPETEPKLPTDEELLQELMVRPEPLPGPPEWPVLPNPGSVKFHAETFPAAAVRPQDPVKDLLIRAIDASEKSIDLALYELKFTEIVDALRRAKGRGLKIRILLDRGHVFPSGNDHTGDPRQRSKEIQALVDEGFDVHVIRGQDSQGTMHNKLAIFDGMMVKFGSYNWAPTAEDDHFENVVFNAEPERVTFYQRYFEWMLSGSKNFEEAGIPRAKWPKIGNAPVDEDHALEFNGERFPRQAVSPEGLVEETLIRAIKAAKATIDIAMFSFYSQPIAEALLEAKRRGVVIRLVLDAFQARLMKLDDWFAYHDFEVLLLAGPDDYGNVMFQKNHNKFMIADGAFVETGSFNYSGNAQNNSFENANFFTEKLKVAFYAAYFRMLHSLGWKALKPSRPPELTRPGAEFFGGPSDASQAERLGFAAALDE